MQEVKPIRKKLSKKHLLLYVALFGFVLYSAITIINQNIAISEKRQELAALQQELEIIDIENQYLEEVKNYKGDDLDEFIKDKARKDLDYINNGERVFVNVYGN